MRIFKAVVVRLLFVTHIFLCVYRLWEEKEEKENAWAWWLIGVFSALLLIVEAVVTLGSTKHGEWHGFTPCIFIYLLGAVPALCLTEWSLLDRRIENQNNGTCPDYTANVNSSLDIPGVVQIDYNFSLALHQILVILLVAGRWLLPKGKMSREKLSNILLAYVGMAADILEFYAEGLQRDEIRCERIVVRAILCLWAISLVQFPFTLSEDSKTKRRKSLSQTNETLLQRIKNADVWAIVMIVVLQDGPFLGTRLYMIFKYKILDQILLFFTFKNFLIVMLQFYRLWILLCFTWEADEAKFSLRMVASIRHKWRGDKNNNRQHGVERANEAFEESDDEDEEEHDTFHPQRESNYPQRPVPTTGPQPQHAHGTRQWKTKMMNFKMNKFGFNRKRDNAQPQSPGATTIHAPQHAHGEPYTGQHHIQANGYGPSRDASHIQQPPNASTSPPGPAFPDQNTRGFGEPHPMQEQPAFVFTDPSNPVSPPQQQQQQQPTFVYNDPNRTANAGTSRNPYPAEFGKSFNYQPHQRDPGNFQSSRGDLLSDVPHRSSHEVNPDHLGWPGYRQHYQRGKRTEYAYRPYDQESGRYNSRRNYRSPYSVGQRGGDVYYGRR